MTTDRDQWSRVFLNDPENYFVTDRNPPKIFCKKQNPKLKKTPSLDTVHLAKVKQNMIIMKNYVY